MSVLLLNGPNLNLLGTREPEIYGATSLSDIEQQVVNRLDAAGISSHVYQSNAEHELIESVHKAQAEAVELILINPAAFTHTSVALRDALAGVKIPFIEIHLSNPHQREPFRHQSYFSDLAEGVIAGFGVDSYLKAADMAIKFLNQK